MFRTLFVGAVLQTALGVALALPPDQLVQYHIKSDPLNPLSTTVVSVTLKLHATQQVDDEIAWQVLKIWIWRPGVGSLDEFWTEDLPTVQTSDGLWWVAHQNPAQPAIPEFTAPPLISGRATRVGQGDDLAYSIEALSDPPDPPPGVQEPYESISWFYFYYFRYWNQQNPFEQGRDKWIWIPPTPVVPEIV